MATRDATATDEHGRRKVGGIAIVVGASMAGLCAARILADRFERVVVLDRDTLLDGAEPRRLVPQGRHPHLLLVAGARLLESWFPGLIDELHRAGAVDLDLCHDFLWHQAGGVQQRPASALRGPAMSRPLLESIVRRRVAAHHNVEIRDQTTVTGLLSDPQHQRILGVRVGDEELTGELVVDATGRAARTLDWIQDVGYPAPRTSIVEVDTRYVSRIYRRTSVPKRDWQAAAVVGDPDSKRLAMLLPAEHDTWILAVAGINGESPPTDDAEMLDYARGFESPVIADVINSSEALGEPVTHRFPANLRRHVESMRRFPIGWALLGDAVCSYDPIYGQGMTSAALQAEALGKALDRIGSVSRPFARAYFRAAGRIVTTPWSIAVGGDFAYAGTSGHKPFGTDVLNHYMDRVIKAGQVDAHVVIRLNEVVSLVRNPQTLLSPGFALRVLRKARHADRVAADRVAANRHRDSTVPTPAGRSSP
jgi:2-polyprenyl-6-methoxyphenol hydroxylase-like FAD-dependent oxidoreductase